MMWFSPTRALAVLSLFSPAVVQLHVDAIDLDPTQPGAMSLLILFAP